MLTYYFEAITKNLSFLTDLDRLFHLDYVPADQDLLRQHWPTSALSSFKHTFGNIAYNLFDIGGERIFRKKWIHKFDRADKILFFVPLSSFNLLLNESRTQVNFSSVCKIAHVQKFTVI